MIIADLVNRYLEDGHYENVKGIYRWDKMKPSFPTVLKKGRSGRTPVYNGTPIPQNLDELEAEIVSKNYKEYEKYINKNI